MSSGGVSFNYDGPNIDAVRTTNDKAIASGLSGGFDLNEILTAQDKAITGYDPNDVKNPNAAAIALLLNATTAI